MLTKRIVPCLDIKDGRTVKGVNFVDLRDAGDPIELAERYAKEGARLYRVLNERLEGRDYIAGEGRGMYTIADMACWPWVSRFEWQENDLNDYPNIRDWYLRIAERPAVQKGYSVPKFTTDVPMP